MANRASAAQAPAASARATGALVFSNSSTALGVVRSLGRRGIPVWVLRQSSPLAGASRYAEHSVDFRGLDEINQVEALVQLAEDHDLRGWVLFPDGDKSVALMARHRDTLSRVFSCTVPEWDVVRWALDKQLTYQLCEELGIEYPRTFYPASIDDVERLDGTFPMLLKPLNHEGTDRFSMIAGAWRVDDRKALLKRYAQASAAVCGRAVIAVQEMVPGRDGSHVCYGALCKEGRVLVSVSACRTRLLPVDFGSSASDVTIETIPEVESAAQLWLKALRYTGLADLQFKRHAGTGRYVLLDVNARPWLWQPTATYAGIDFPYLTWRLAQGKDVSAGPPLIGVRWVRTPYDAMSALQLIWRGDLTWRAYAESIQGAHHEMFQRDDLGPALVEVPVLLKLVWNKMRGR